MAKWNKTLFSIYPETHPVFPNWVHEFLGDSLHVVVHVVALEVDRHVHRLHRTGLASPCQSSVAWSRHVGYGLCWSSKGLRNWRSWWFFLCVWLLRDWGKEPFKSLSFLPQFFFPCGCWFVLKFWVWFFHVGLMIFFMLEVLVEDRDFVWIFHVYLLRKYKKREENLRLF